MSRDLLAPRYVIMPRATGHVGALRAVKTRPGQGGWQMFHTLHAGPPIIAPDHASAAM